MTCWWGAGWLADWLAGWLAGWLGWLDGWAGWMAGLDWLDCLGKLGWMIRDAIGIG